MSAFQDRRKSDGQKIRERGERRGKERMVASSTLQETRAKKRPKEESREEWRLLRIPNWEEEEKKRGRRNKQLPWHLAKAKEGRKSN